MTGPFGPRAHKHKLLIWSLTMLNHFTLRLTLLRIHLIKRLEHQRNLNSSCPSLHTQLLVDAIVRSVHELLTSHSLYTGRSPVGPEARPAAAIVNSPVCARTMLPLTSAQFIKVTKVRHQNESRKSLTKLPQKSMLREFA